MPNTKETFMQKTSGMMAQLQDLEKDGSRRTLASYCQALALPPGVKVTLNILAGASPYRIKIKGQFRPQKEWREVQQDYESRLSSAVLRVKEFCDLVLYCLDTVPYLNKPFVELLMMPEFSFRQRYDVLSALLRKELQVQLFALLPNISLELAYRVYDKIFSKKEQRTIVLQTSNDRYHVVPKKDDFKYYVAVQCKAHDLIDKKMPERA